MSSQDGPQTKVDDMNANISRVCHVNFVSVCYDEVFHNFMKLQDYVLCWMLVRETHYDTSKYKSWAVTLLNIHTFSSSPHYYSIHIGTWTQTNIPNHYDDRQSRIISIETMVLVVKTNFMDSPQIVFLLLAINVILLLSVYLL